MKRFALLFVLTLLFCSEDLAQTYLYKRVAIVKNGNRQTVNDDAHYLTFNKNGCYESDANGYSLGGDLIKFRKDENNIHCYYGNGMYGPSHYYFSSNYERLNIKIDDETFVYERETNDRTTASFRKYEDVNGKNGVMVITPPSVVSSGSSPSASGSSSSSRQSDYGYVDCTRCWGSGKCSLCNGSGWDYSLYTQEPTLCSSCEGRKICVFCQGTGKTYRRIR